MKHLLVVICLSVIQTSISQIHTQTYKEIGVLISEELVDGSCRWIINSDSSAILYQHFNSSLSLLDQEILTVNDKFKTKSTNTFTFAVELKKFTFLITFWDDNSLVSYTYPDESFFLMWGKINHWTSTESINEYKH
jgi:hypothetical protein